MLANEAKVPFTQSRASIGLDAIRGVAALVVTLEHLRYRLFFVFTPEDLHHPWLRGLFVLSQLGHSAVITFFVLSGFLVGGSLLRAHQANRWSWRSYFTHRFVRLWIVLLPALLMGYVWDRSTIYFGSLNLHTPEVQARIVQTARDLTARAFMGNIFFLQDVLVPVFGSNGPLWSLVNEFWYYVLFPLGFFAIVPRYSQAWRIAYLVTGILLAFGLHSAILSYAPLWLMGALLFFLPQPGCGERTRAITLCAFALSVPILVKLSFRFPLSADYLLAVMVSVTIWVLLSARARAKPASFANRFFRLLARFSYTLYLVHVPIFTFVGVCLIHDQPWRPTVPHLCFAGAVWIGTLLLAYGIASLTEFKTERARHRVETWMNLAARTQSSFDSKRAHS